MSTKIYNGYRLEISNFVTLRAKFKDLQFRMEKIKETHLIDKMDMMLVQKMDQLQLDETLQPRTLKEAKAEIREEVWRKIYEAEKSPYNSWPWDLKVSVTVIPLEHITLALFFGHLKEHTELWESLDWVKDYHYQNQTDEPDDVPASEWDQRRKDWDIALPGAGVPCLEGFDMVLCEQQFPFELKWTPNFLVAGSPADRAARRARERAMDEFGRKEWKAGHDEDQRPSVNEIMQVRGKASDWLKTDEGKALVEKYKAEILPKLKEVYE